jgi:hypothetical protein
MNEEEMELKSESESESASLLAEWGEESQLLTR